MSRGTKEILERQVSKCTLAYPTSVYIVHSSSDKGCFITKQERNDTRYLNRLAPSLLRRYLETAFHVFWILTLRHGCVDRAWFVTCQPCPSQCGSAENRIPGETQLTLICWFSLAAVLVNPITAALVEQYAELPGAPNCPNTLAAETWTGD